ncbi:hypothetical protein TGMAS_310920, partial [Toxoplasma gondii MAS]
QCWSAVDEEGEAGESGCREEERKVKGERDPSAEDVSRIGSSRTSETNWFSEAAGDSKKRAVRGTDQQRERDIVEPGVARTTADDSGDAWVTAKSASVEYE